MWGTALRRNESSWCKFKDRFNFGLNKLRLRVMYRDMGALPSRLGLKWPGPPALVVGRKQHERQRTLQFLSNTNSNTVLDHTYHHHSRCRVSLSRKKRHHVHNA